MKKTHAMDQRSQINFQEWCKRIEIGEEDDFLLGKSPQDLEFPWEDEE